MAKYLKDTVLYIKEHANELEDPTPQDFAYLLKGSNDASSMAQFLYDECGINPLELLEDEVDKFSELFGWDDKLTNIVVPGVCKEIPAKTFYRCENLNTVTLKEGVKGCAFHAFYRTAITELNLPDSFESFGTSSFEGCHNLASINLNKVTSIAWSTFANCDSLTSITIPSTCGYVGECAFKYCANLESVTIEDGLVHLGSMPFLGCDKIKVIEIPQTITIIDDSPGGDWMNGHYNSGKIKYRIKGLNKADGRAWAAKNIMFSNDWWRDLFIHKII